MIYKEIETLMESANILRGDTVSLLRNHEISTVLEDVNSPIRNKFNEKLFDSVIDKKHIDFDNIPASKGDIDKYTGTKPMKETLVVLAGLQSDMKNISDDYINTISTAISNIAKYKDLYGNGFKLKNDFVMLEYNTLVYTCVEATTSLIYQFVDIFKNPTQDTNTLVIRNTKYKANLFYLDQLRKYNTVIKKMGNDYRKYLTNMLDKGNESNFIGTATMVGAATVGLVALSIIPITRELVNQYYNIRHKLSSSLAYHAYLLEMNKAIIEGNNTFNASKKKSILAKQETIKNQLIKLSDLLRVSNVKTGEKRMASIEKENKTMTIDSIKRQVDSSPLELL